MWEAIYVISVFLQDLAFLEEGSEKYKEGSSDLAALGLNTQAQWHLRYAMFTIHHAPRHQIAMIFMF